MSETADVADRLATITAEEFETQVGQAFSFSHSDHKFPGTIDFVRRLSNRRPEAVRAPFAVELTIAGSKYFHQMTVTFANEALGEFEVFAVPVGPGPGGVRYELVFT